MSIAVLPSELLLKLALYLPFPDLSRLCRTRKRLQALLALHSQSIFRPRLLALGIPDSDTVISNPATLLKDISIWLGMQDAARRRTQGLKRADEIDLERKDPRVYFAAISGTVEGGSELSVRLLGSAHLCAGTTPFFSVYRIDGPGRPDSVLDREHVKWIDNDSAMIASAAEPSYISLNEWAGPVYEGGHAAIFNAMDLARLRDAKPMFAGRIAKTSHSAFTSGEYLACCTAWWILPDPSDSNMGVDDEDETPPSKGEICLYKINSSGEPLTKLWTHVLPARTRPRSLCISATHVHSSIDASPTNYILSLPITPFGGSAVPMTTLTDSSPLCLHALDSVIISQTPGDLTIYVHLGSTRLHPIMVIPVGDVQRVALATHPRSRDPVLLVRDICHPDRLCVIRPALRTSKWFVAPRVSGDAGVWCLYLKEGKDVGVTWKPIIV
ncbi:hypothetical protein HDU86_008209 [Geranomyces michiganensis]|nr:hypothetical protein HDU86_008209 [Geranomyces michiganensis]